MQAIFIFMKIGKGKEAGHTIDFSMLHKFTAVTIKKLGTDGK